jgi:hypothetical protein
MLSDRRAGLDPGHLIGAWRSSWLTRFPALRPLFDLTLAMLPKPDYRTGTGTVFVSCIHSDLMIAGMKVAHQDSCSA